MKQLKFASIDIGSNAVRFLMSYVFETESGPMFRKGILLRVPLRLGEDSFQFGRITKDKETKLIDTMLSFKHLMATQDILGYKAFATSAMRDAKNSKALVAAVYNIAGIKIDVISGDEEAHIIAGQEAPSYLRLPSKMLFVDVGGGSTELTYYSKKKIERKSFDIGTIRLMYGTVGENSWNDLNSWLLDIGIKDSGIPILGSGGNINKIYKLKRRRVTDFHISVSSLKDFYNEIKDLSYEQKIIQHQLNPDRSDVIVPACEIFLDVVQITGTQKIYVPKTGLSDGIVRNLYEQYKLDHNKRGR